MAVMKRLGHGLFPLLFALASLSVFWVLHRFAPSATEKITALFVFCTALSWSAMIHQLPRGYQGWCLLYLLLALAIPLPLILGSPRSGFLPLQHDTLYLLMIFGILELKFYMVTSEKKSRPPPISLTDRGVPHG